MSRLRTGILPLIAVLASLALAACGNGKVIGSGPPATPTPTTPSVTFEYTVPTSAAQPGTIATGSDSYLYFTEAAASKIGRMSTGGAFKEVSTASAGAQPTDIIVGPDHNLWYTESAVKKIGTMTSYTNNTMLDYAVPWGVAPAFIATGYSQNTMYFTDPGANAIGEIATNGTITGPFVIPTTNAHPEGIALGSDTGMWFTETNAGQIGRLNTATNTIDPPYVLAAGANPTGIVQGSDGAMWFTENISGAPKLGRLTTTGTLTEFALTGAQSATAIIMDIFGNFEIADPAGNKIGVFAVTSKTFTEYPVTTASAGPSSFTLGPDGKIYFTEQTANKIGQFTYY